MWSWPKRCLQTSSLFALVWMLSVYCMFLWHGWPSITHCCPAQIQVCLQFIFMEVVYCVYHHHHHVTSDHVIWSFSSFSIPYCTIVRLMIRCCLRLLVDLSRWPQLTAPSRKTNSMCYSAKSTLKPVYTNNLVILDMEWLHLWHIIKLEIFSHQRTKNFGPRETSSLDTRVTATTLHNFPGNAGSVSLEFSPLTSLLATICLQFSVITLLRAKDLCDRDLLGKTLSDEGPGSNCRL